MQKQAALIYQDSQFVLTGDLHFKNVMALNQLFLAKMNTSPELNFDLSQVTSTDSSGLALLIEWVRLANRAKKKITFKNLSNGLLELAKASGLDAVLTPLMKS